MEDINNNDVTKNLVDDLIKEKRAERRWKNIRFIAWFALILYVIVTLMSHFGKLGSRTTTFTGDYVSLIRLDGMIAPGRDFSATELTPLLKKAFSDQHASGVVIDINSPGGTPVQAAIIHDVIVAFKQEYKKKVIIVGEDLLTSGAYYVAVAGDKIYVNPNTITGSIGVIMKGFGFVDLIKKIGIERRVYMAGADKDRLDPFLPQTPEDLQKINEVISEVHQNFTRAVLESRKDKLHADPKILFNGDFWSGETALKLGLVDGLGNLLEVTNKEFHTTQFQEYSSSSSLFRMLGGQLGTMFDSFIYAYR